MDTLPFSQFRACIDTGDVQSVAIRANGGSFEIQIAMPGAILLLGNVADGALPYQFADAEAARKLLGEFGLDEGARQSTARAAYDAWMRAKVAASIAGLDDGSNPVYTAEEWHSIRAAKKASRDA